MAQISTLFCSSAVLWLGVITGDFHAIRNMFYGVSFILFFVTHYTKYQ